MNDVHLLNLITDLLADKLEFGGGYAKAGRMLDDEYGMTVLGSGASGICCVHPFDKTKVVRINGDVGSDSWTSFILFTREWYAPCFPKVYTQRHVHDGLMITIMEKLIPWNDSEPGSHRLRDAINNREIDTLQQIFKSPLSVDRILKMRDTIGYANDLHGGNYMRRASTGELVLIDPYHMCGQSPKYRTGPDSRFKMGKRVTVEVQTYEQRAENDAILAQLSQEVAAKRAEENRMLRPQPKHADHAQPERLYRPLFPKLRDGWVREGGAIDAAPAPRKERIEFRPDWRLRGKVAPNFLHAADFAELEAIVLADLLRPQGRPIQGRRADILILDSISVPKPVRHKPEPIFRVEHNARPEGRQASVPGKRPKKWEAAVPCQKAAAERKRERAEIYRKLHRRAA